MFEINVTDPMVITLANKVRGYGDKLKKSVSRIQNSLNGVLEEGDTVTLNAGLAGIGEVDDKGVITPFYQFSGVLTKATGQTSPINVSVRQLISPTIGLKLTNDGALLRDALTYRFGKGNVSFVDITASDGTVETVPVLNENMSFKIVKKDVYEPSFSTGSYDKDLQGWPKPTERKGYAIAAQ